MKGFVIPVIALALGLAGCDLGSSSTSTSPSPVAGSSSSPSAGASASASALPPNGVAINLTVTGNKISPENPSVKKGQVVVMTVTTDKSEDIHLHGYEQLFKCQAGQPYTITFTADKTGNFEIEIEESSTHLTDIAVLP